ncbi:MAG TPA: hydantoinase/oxoprolinase family protein [Candidatus Acidoferrum sp.]|nr:hydantoinase/oxoprolinase family protein [Candidatus Acidoferrum sp.]
MRIAFDTGGTFTDCVFLRGGRIEILKVPSTSRKPSDAIAHALGRIRELFADSGGLELICGTTVGTNALLQRRGGRVVLVTTAGFEDVLEIGRQARPQLYNLLFEKPEPLVPQARCLGLRERLDSDGRVLLAPSRTEIARIAGATVRSGADSIAVCLLFSFVNPTHEKLLARALAATGLPVSVSHEILPEYREFERTSTTVVNAYLVPVMSGYLSEIVGIAKAQSRSAPVRSRAANTRSRVARVRIMQSNGGILSAGAAAREPVRTILSGPAGGVLGAQYIAELAGFERIITFDMGGTSTDVALMDSGNEEALATTSESAVSGMPVAAPMLDIHTVGAGGGSIARFDRAGALRVGPESAGAEPGPICYGRGEKTTVTDANLILGRIPESGLLGGAFKLDLSRARRYVNRARGPMPSAEAFAQGIVDVANAVMEKAIRVISVERGHDPREFTLVAFGGAGALHACKLAEALEIPRVLVPCFPGALSALGILRADVTKDLSRTVRLKVENAAATMPKLQRAFATLEQEGRKQMRTEGFSSTAVQIHRSLDMRYAGQSYDLAVPFTGNFIAAFHRAHEMRYGYSDRTRACEVVNIRARFTGRTPKPALPELRPGGPSSAPALVAKSQVLFHGRRNLAAVYDRSLLRAGNRISGPAIVTEYSATSLIPPAWSGRVDRMGNLILEPRR